MSVISCDTSLVGIFSFHSYNFTSEEPSQPRLGTKHLDLCREHFFFPNLGLNRRGAGLGRIKILDIVPIKRSTRLIRSDQHGLQSREPHERSFKSFV